MAAQDLSDPISDGITMPPDCTFLRYHRNNDGIASKCKFFDCNCQCDLTAGTCDMNCCCDHDCLEEEVTSFTLCLNNLSINPTTKMCDKTHTKIETIRPNYPERVGDSPEVKSLYTLLYT